MSPFGWAMRPLKRYAQFSGRAPRAEFWWFSLSLLIIYVVISIAMVGVVGSLTSPDDEPSVAMVGAMGVGGILMVVFWLAVLVPVLAVQTRRLHDINRSGWWLVGYYVVYLVYMLLVVGALGSALNAEATEATASGALTVAGAIVALLFFIYSIVLLVFYCLPGTKGPNRYGADPYGEDIAEVFA